MRRCRKTVLPFVFDDDDGHIWSGDTDFLSASDAWFLMALRHQYKKPEGHLGPKILSLSNACVGTVLALASDHAILQFIQ